jgi:Tfp pilus assembly protein PilX
MQSFKHTVNSQEGATLIIVLLVLVSLTALAITAMNISTTEINLAGNDKWQKTGLYNGDGGLHGTPSIIYPNLNPDTDAPLPAAPLAAANADPNTVTDQGCLEYINGMTPADFYTLVYAKKEDPEADTKANKDISFRNCGIAADIDICPRGSQQLSGGGVEFASRSEGTGISGSEAKVYRITSTGDGSNNSTYTVRGHYRWVETGGGLR